MVWKNYTKEKLTGPPGMQGKRGPRGPRGKMGPQGNRASRGARGPDGDRGPMGNSAACWDDSNAKRCTSNWESMGLTRREDLNKGCLFGYQTSFDNNRGKNICLSENTNCSYVKDTGELVVKNPNEDKISWKLEKDKLQNWRWLQSSQDNEAKLKFNNWVRSLRNKNCPGVPMSDTNAIRLAGM